MAGRFLLGIDAGGTHTRALLTDTSGHALGAGHAGAANVHAASQTFATSSVRNAVAASIERAGLEAPVAVAGCVLASAGLEDEDGADAVYALLEGLVVGDAGRMVSDVHAAWAGALGMEPGVLVVSGTGSICLGVDAEGRRTRVGGWGPRFGDEGSAYRIAADAIGIALRTLDGREREPEILQAFLSFAGLSLDGGQPPFAPVVDWLYASDRTNAEIARFAPVVDALARTGVDAAHEILDRAAASLARMAWAAFAGTSEHVAVSYSGGVLANSAAVRDLLRGHLQGIVESDGRGGSHDAEAQAGFAWIEPRLSPVAGAVLLAAECLNGVVDVNVVLGGLESGH